MPVFQVRTENQQLKAIAVMLLCVRNNKLHAEKNPLSRSDLQLHSVNFFLKSILRLLLAQAQKHITVMSVAVGL